MQAALFEYLKSKPDIELLVTKDDKETKKALDCALYLGYDAFALPDLRAVKGDDLRPYKEEMVELNLSLSRYHLLKSDRKVLISPFRTILNNLPKKQLFKSISFEFSDSLDLKEIKEKFLFWGYEFVDIVQEVGEVSFRGDVVDIFSPNSSAPIRISLFDSEIESIRYFDQESQKSQKDEMESISIIPAIYGLDALEYEKLNSRVLKLESDSFIKDISSVGLWVLEDLSKDYLKSLKSVLLFSIDKEVDDFFTLFDSLEKKEYFLNLKKISEPKEYKDIEVVDIVSFLEYHKDKNIEIIASNEALIKQSQIPKNIDIKYRYSRLILNLLGHNELIVSLNKEGKKRRKRGSSLVIDELKIGDYVVHENYGIGIFKGLKNTKVLGAVRDFVEIAYHGEDRLLIPVENLYLIDRYISNGSVAVVDKLGKGSFIKLKERSRAKLFEIAKEIIKSAANRELVEALKIESNFDELKLFQNDAGFIYTDDQIKSVDEIFEDLKSGRVMDRLLSGDVGFGKSEVAMNAIFATVKSGYQAAFLVPTTLLCSQHFKTLDSRFKKYGIKVKKLDRFTSAKDKKIVLQEIRDGSIDVVIGTHSIFGVEFNNLALLVLDEEHKFGVKQKEKLKSLKESVHILSMSATPIPRSLNMALSKIKSYSQLLTPPSQREDIRTFVKEFDQKLIKEVILREIRRGGQIFYLHNQISTIYSKEREISELLPDLRILVLHSKVSAAISEREIMAFERGEYDLLISTTIIESGIHIPNVNSIIVESADRFGMADLHQLRGRVGRGDKIGYCYFLVKDKQTLTESSKKRLIALESNSFLGSGAVLAYHDLEIRGGGNLIGEAQSGHIKNIGYALYIKMLEDALNILLNSKSAKDSEVEIKLSVSAYLNSQIIGEDRVRLEIYRRLSICKSAIEVYEIEEELIDRFGEVDEVTKNFLEIIVIKILASKKGIKLISSYGDNITVVYNSDIKEYLKSPSKDSDDIISTTLKFLRG